MKTIKITAVIGVTEGYGHENGVADAVALVASAWQVAAAGDIYLSTGMYVSAVCSEASTVYHTEWGCPVGGEQTVRIETSANPSFIKDMDLWQEVAISIIKKIKDDLKQSTVAIEVTEVSNFIYLQ